MCGDLIFICRKHWHFFLPMIFLNSELRVVFFKHFCLFCWCVRDRCFFFSFRVQCSLVLSFWNYWFCFLGVVGAFFVSEIKQFFVIFAIYRRYILVFIEILDCWKFIFGFIELQNEKLFNCECASCVFIVFQVVFLVIITDFIGWVDELLLTTIVFCFSQCFLESLFCVWEID